MGYRVVQTRVYKYQTQFYLIFFYFSLSWYNFVLLRKIQWKAVFRAFINWQTEQWILQITCRRWLHTTPTCAALANWRIVFQSDTFGPVIKESECSAQNHRHSFIYLYLMGPISSLCDSFWKHDSMWKFEIWSSRWQNANSTSLRQMYL